MKGKIVVEGDAVEKENDDDDVRDDYTIIKNGEDEKGEKEDEWEAQGKK